MILSAVIIAKNEAETISRCLASLSFCDEVVVIDNLSIDKTSNLAEKKGARVFSVSGLDFAYLRNIGREKAKGDWLLYVDADEWISSQLKASIRSAVKSGYAAFAVDRKNYYFGRLWPNRESMVRLVRKDALVGWQGGLHETAQVRGKIGRLDGELMHDTHRDLTGMLEKTNIWSDFEAQLRYKNNHPPISWWRFFRVMISAFWKSYIREKGYLAGTVGLIESLYQSFSMFITYAKLWEKQNNRPVN